ncbi:MAG: lasso peptide biosynthesis B2 protein [Pseudomonadota bacterium]
MVFLDIHTDAYFCLPDAADGVRFDPSKRRLHVADAELGDELISAGLVQTRSAPPAIASHTHVATAQRSALPITAELPRLQDLPEALVCLTDLLLSYRGRGLAEILERAGRPLDRPTPASREVMAIVRRFHRWAPYAPTPAKCLLRSFMLLRLLRRRGFDARWVFGVSTWPFQAHCWLQCDDVVLDDTFERVASYQPLLVL